MPDLLALSCAKCAAPLSVGDSVRYLTCTFCGTRLEVRRKGGAAYAAVLDRLAETTEQLAGDVEGLRLESELERLDREHEAALTSEPSRGPAGARGPGGSLAVVLVGGLVTLFAVGWITMAISMGAPWFFPAFGVGFLAFALVALRRGFLATRQAARLEDDYQRRRVALLEQLASRAAARQTPR